MSIPAGAVKMVFAGTLQGGEVFAHSLWFDHGSTPTQTQLDACQGFALTTFNSVLGTSAIKAQFPTTTSYKTLTLYSYAGGPNADHVSGPGAFAAWVGTGTNSLPNQCSTVLSLLTGTPGRAFRGRTYLPGMGQSQMASTGQWGSASITALGNAWQSYLAGIKAGGGGADPLNPSVMSASRSVLTHLTGFSFDSRVDIQRRRAFKQVVTTNSVFSL